MAKAAARRDFGISQLVQYAAVISAVAALGSIACMLWLERKASNESEQLVWQTVVIHSIIESSPEGITFNDLQGRYFDEISKSTEVVLPKEKLSDITTRRILLSLIENGTVYMDIDNKYIPQRTIMNPRFTRAFIEETTKYEVASLLASDGGKYTVAELSQKISGKTGVQQDEFSMLISQLVAAKLLIIGEDGKVWSAANPPRK